ncbi:hypothetical protein [Inquilinus sp.]|jgi:hypothetical protein|uniref:hypothetical protein n=1 Tax=Inquilinus sp. TaxID=1932117 RepID=UPI003783F120
MAPLDFVQPAPTQPAYSPTDVTDAGACVDRLLALGWRLHLAIHSDGQFGLHEQYAETQEANAEGHSISAFLRETAQRRTAVRQALIERGLFFHTGPAPKIWRETD